jgi:hypothetical protein
VEPFVGIADLADVALPELEPRRELPEEVLGVAPGDGVELVASLVGHHPPLGADGAGDGQRQRAGAASRLEDPSPREDVAVDQERTDVLGVDHLRAPPHLQDEVGQPRAEAAQRRTGRGVHRDALLRPDHQVVRQGAAVEVERVAGLQADQEGAAAVVAEEHPLPSGERLDGHALGARAP